MNPILSDEEAATLLDCSVRRVQELLNAGVLPGWRPGTSWIIPAEAFYARLNELALTEAQRRRGQQLPAPGEQLPAIMPTKRGPGRPRKHPLPGEPAAPSA